LDRSAREMRRLIHSGLSGFSRCCREGVIICLICFICCEALPAQQQLLQMQYEEVPAENILVDRADRGLLIVESTIPRLKFIGSNRPIPAEPGIREMMSGVWHVYLSIGTTLLTIQADGYLPIQDIRLNLQPRQAKKLRVSGDQPKGIGGLRIETEPQGASVILNNLPVPGITPLYITDQPTGTHAVRVEKDGYRPVDETVVVEKDKTVTRRWTLQRVYAGLKVTSDPSGAMVFLDGDRLGTTPLERDDLNLGEVTLVISKDGYEPNSHQVRLVTEHIESIQVSLTPQQGSVSITTNPAGADVFIDGEWIGIFESVPLKVDHLSLGKHYVIAMLEGHSEDTCDFMGIMVKRLR